MMNSSPKRGLNYVTRYVKRPQALIPLVFSIIAFTLSLLCVLAGTKPGYYENVNLLTVNASMIGHIHVNFNLSTKNLFKRQMLLWDEMKDQLDEAKDILEYFTQQGDEAVQNITQEGNEVLQNVTNNAVNIVADKLAQALNLHDFYSAHILSYCEGYYTPSALPNTTQRSRKNVTRCSAPTALFHFNPTQIVQSELIPGIDLADLHWPEKIRDVTEAAKDAGKTLFIFYCFGIGMTGLALVGAIAELFMTGNRSLAVNTTFTVLAFLFLTIASAVTTAIIVKAVNGINKYGNDIGIVAYKGSTFVGMTWAAAALMLLGFALWTIMLIRGRGETRGTEKSRGFSHRMKALHGLKATQAGQGTQA